MIGPRTQLNQMGMGLVENLVALMILVVGSYFIMSATTAFKELSSHVETDSAEDKQVLQIIENIRTSPESYQIAFVDSDQKDFSLEVSKLPMAWSDTMIATAESCADCPGRFGFMVHPFAGMRGLYLVTLRFTHKTWKEEFKDYEFVVSAR